MTIHEKFTYNQLSERNRPRTELEKIERWKKAALRIAQRDYFCDICEFDIKAGTYYKDSGGRIRAHYDCVENLLGE